MSYSDEKKLQRIEVPKYNHGPIEIFMESRQCFALVLNTIHDDKVHDQSLTKTGLKATCWANAAAQAIISTQKRIHGRTVSTHDELRDYLIYKYGNCSCIKKCGNCGQDPYRILQIECKQRYMICNVVSLKDAIKAVRSERTIVGAFQLNKRQWEIFSTFFKEKPDCILIRDVFYYPEKYLVSPSYTKVPQKDFGIYEGHAVALVAHEDGIYGGKKTCETYWKVKNSWGVGWGHSGYFYMKETALPNGMRYIDVGFRIMDLPYRERYYEQ